VSSVLFLEQETTLKTNSFDRFASTQLEISREIGTLFSKERGIDLNLLERELPSAVDINSVKTILLKAGFTQIDEFISALQKMERNSVRLKSENPQIEMISTSDFESALSNKINSLSIKEEDNIEKRTPEEVLCYDNRRRAEDRCVRNYAISMGVVIVSGLISAGWGTVIGFGAAHAMEVVCIADAQGDFERCMG